jgi:hypothetical protein
MYESSGLIGFNLPWSYLNPLYPSFSALWSSSNKFDDEKISKPESV